MFINDSKNKSKRFNVLPWEILFRFFSLPWQERENCMLTFLREIVISIFIFFPPIKYKYEVTEDDLWLFIFHLLQSFFVLLHSWKSYVQAISLMLQTEKKRPHQSVISLSNLTQYQGLFQWVSSSHQVAKVLEFQYQSFQWIFRVHFF